MELWDLYNSDREKTGETAVRGRILPDNKRHIVVNMCIINSCGKMLIQKRTDDKDCWPSLWATSAGGSAQKGETSSQAAHRELMEEIGIDYDFTDKAPDFSISNYRRFADFYIIKMDVDIKRLKLQKEEVTAVKWASKDEILRMIDNKEFIPYFKSSVEMIFEMAFNEGV